MTLSQLIAGPVGRMLARRRREETRRLRVKPAIGSTICCADVRMTVQAGMSDELWQWLVAQGWRPLAPREDRYRFRALPSAHVAALFDAAPDDRERYLLAALRLARGELAPAGA